MPNTLYFGDNLTVMREQIASESVDLIYLDPPFNSNRSYNVLFKDESGTDSQAQIMAFGDTWHWDRVAQTTYDDLIQNGSQNVGTMIDALHTGLGPNEMMAYLVMLTARLVEMHRVLKPTGSLYLHCDQTAGLYLRNVLDAVFGKTHFHDLIIWKRTSAHSDSGRYGANVDLIYFYTKGDTWTWNPVFKKHDENYLKRFRHKDEDGRLWTDADLTAKGLTGGGYEYEYKGVSSLWRVPEKTMRKLDAEGRLHFTNKGGLRLKRYLDNTQGTPLQRLWDDIPPINSQAAERLGYPTQKPLALLERIIKVSSNPGDVVFDPFCGCGTAIAAAQGLGRQWIGIDITYIAIALIRQRMKDMYGASLAYKVIGMPEDLDSARQLALLSDHDGRYQFQFWALSLVQAKPVGAEASVGKTGKAGKKGADRGIDGVIPFVDDSTGKRKQILVQVKSGHVKSGDIRDLKGAIEREKAAMGVFITLESPTADMQHEASTAGSYRSINWQRDYARIQILSIADLLAGKNVDMPPIRGMAYKHAARVGDSEAEQLNLEL